MGKDEKRGKEAVGKYGLHDSIIREMQLKGNRLILRFENGIAKTVGDDSVFVPGKVLFYDVDLDFCHVYVLNKFKNGGRFQGRKWPLSKFIKRHSGVHMEVLSVTDSRYETLLSGIVHDEKGRITDKEFFLDIVCMGGMEYVEKNA